MPLCYAFENRLLKLPYFHLRGHVCIFVKPPPSHQATYYALRPEVIESLFYLHQITGNPVYREWGWKIFTSIET